MSQEEKFLARGKAADSEVPLQEVKPLPPPRTTRDIPTNAGGRWLFALGLIGALYFILAYDPTVDTMNGGRVYNLGGVQAKLLGTMLCAMVAQTGVICAWLSNRR
ncbi:MAG: hypothetical protein NTW87_29070 [Planctomycetota bacterium]|nr:hypothetical protein [Planctomycetota bacterium]